MDFETYNRLAPNYFMIDNPEIRRIKSKVDLLNELKVQTQKLSKAEQEQKRRDNLINDIKIMKKSITGIEKEYRNLKTIFLKEDDLLDGEGYRKALQ